MTPQQTERNIDRPNEFTIDRANTPFHLSFGFGIHRYMGNRPNEMHLRALWEEILKRFPMVWVVGEPAYLHFGPVTRKALVTAATGHQSLLSKNP